MAPVQPTAAWPDYLRFIGRFVRHPGTVGSLVPSSRRLASAMVAPMERQAAAGPLTIVELGAGTGAFTRAIVEGLSPGDRFLSVEIDPTFVEALRRRWPDVDCVCASAELLRVLVTERHLGPIDHIVSGLPFATLPVHTTRRIVIAICKTLRTNGTFTTFHYVHSYGVPRAVAFRRQMTALMASTPSTRLVASNLPPALVVSWTNRRTTRPSMSGTVVTPAE